MGSCGQDLTSLPPPSSGFELGGVVLCGGNLLHGHGAGWADFGLANTYLPHMLPRERRRQDDHPLAILRLGGGGQSRIGLRLIRPVVALRMGLLGWRAGRYAEALDASWAGRHWGGSGS